MLFAAEAVVLPFRDQAVRVGFLGQDAESLVIFEHRFMAKRVDFPLWENAFVVKDRRRFSLVVKRVFREHVLDIAKSIAFIIRNSQRRIGDVFVARCFHLVHFAKLVGRGYSGGSSGEPGHVMPTLRSRV